jgi:hypothetical protein
VDPNAALEFALEAIGAEDFCQARNHLSSLKCWLADGGFSPDWQRLGPRVASVFHDVLEGLIRGQLQCNCLACQESRGEAGL